MNHDIARVVESRGKTRAVGVQSDAILAGNGHDIACNETAHDIVRSTLHEVIPCFGILGNAVDVFTSGCLRRPVCCSGPT